MSKRLLGEKEEGEPHSRRDNGKGEERRERNEGRYTKWKLAVSGWHVLGQQGWAHGSFFCAFTSCTGCEWRERHDGTCISQRECD